MPNQPISHEWWRSFLFDIASCFAGAPTSIKVRERPTNEGRWGQIPVPTSYEEHDLVCALPLIDLDYELYPKETIRLSLLQWNESLATIEVEYPLVISLLDVEKEPHSLNGSKPTSVELNGNARSIQRSNTGVAFCIETTKQIYTVVILHKVH